MSRTLPPLLAALLLASCSGNRPAPKPPLFSLSPSWKTLLGEFVVAPLAADASHVYVATRDGAVRALDPATGAVVWKAADLPGRLSATDDVLLLRGEDGALLRLQPETGGLRWKTETGVAGLMPAVIDGDRAFVAGKGLAAVELASGRILWKDTTGAPTTAPPVSSGSRLYSGDEDGTLRCRDRAVGLTLWTLRTGGPLAAPPLVDERRRRLYLGTTDKRILEVSTDKGKKGWTWRVGADILYPGLLLPDRVVFGSLDAVLYVLGRGGSLDWRGPLPSRPLAAPLPVGDHLLVACLEDQIVGFARDTGKKSGQLRTSAEIRTPPILAGGLVVLGLRDRSVIAYAPPGSAAPAAPAQEPKTPPEAEPKAPPVVPPGAAR